MNVVSTLRNFNQEMLRDRIYRIYTRQEDSCYGGSSLRLLLHPFWVRQEYPCQGKFVHHLFFTNLFFTMRAEDAVTLTIGLKRPHLPTTGVGLRFRSEASIKIWELGIGGSTNSSLILA